MTEDLRPTSPTKTIYELLAFIYGNDVADKHQPLVDQLIAEKKPHLQPKQHLFNEHSSILIAYPDHLRQSSRTPLQTLHSWKNLYGLVDTIHILPHYPYTSDDGFAVSDYTTVDPNNGSWDDVRRMSEKYHVMLDAVFNHVSASHPWFQAFLAGDERYQDYFVVLEPETDVSMVTRPRTHPLLTPFETVNGIKYVWTTFSTDQIDLNYGNPRVLMELLGIMLEYVQHGADVLRLDAIGFVWREPGTTSIHHPKTHAIVQLFRAVLEQAAPWVWVVTETNVPHEENISYFGNGNDEAHMVYNFALPPLLMHTLHSGDSTAFDKWARELSVPSDKTTFFNFTASHDGIGVRGVTGILSDEEIEELCKITVRAGGRLSMRVNPDGTESVYEMNVTYFNAIAGFDVSSQGDIGEAIDRFICSQSIALCMAGVPGIYLPSLFGGINWAEGLSETGHNRTINRQKFDIEELEDRINSDTTRESVVYERYAHLLKIRAGQSSFRPQASQVILGMGSEIVAIERDDSLLALHNVTGHEVTVSLPYPGDDLLTNQKLKGGITLNPYQVVWLSKAA